MVDAERFKSKAMRCTVAPPAKRTNTSNSLSDSLSTGDFVPPSNSASASFWASANSPQCLEAAHARHGKIHHHHVRFELQIELACSFAAVGLGDHRHFRGRLKQQAKSHAHHGVIVDQQHANHA